MITKRELKEAEDYLHGHFWECPECLNTFFKPALAGATWTCPGCRAALRVIPKSEALAEALRDEAKVAHLRAALRLAREAAEMLKKIEQQFGHGVQAKHGRECPDCQRHQTASAAITAIDQFLQE